MAREKAEEPGEASLSKSFPKSWLASQQTLGSVPLRHKDVKGVRTISPSSRGMGSEEDTTSTPTSDLAAMAPDSQVWVGRDGPPSQEAGKPGLGGRL